MTTMTIGQRIAAQRKLRAMSQEALAEQLEVSRQAVSKWESDGAIPEVDNLIALGRIFGVHVGWLLGTEDECCYEPDAGLNAAQTELAERIVEQCRPPTRPLWKQVTAVACAAGLLLLAGLHHQRRIDALTADNAATQSQLAQLALENQQMRAQLDEMAALLQKQDTASKLLSDYGIRGHASEDLSEVTLLFALTPRVYRETMDASLHITGSDGYAQAYDCRWDGAQYLIRITLPTADGYRFVFRLTGEETWEEEVLNDLDPSLGALKTHTGFAVDPADPAAQGLNSSWPVEDPVYTFDVRLFPPLTQPKSSFAFQELTFTLYHNDTAIWTRDWKADFQSAYGANRNYTLPVSPDIRAELPRLAAGDTLRLELKTVLTGGQERIAVLDQRTVASSQTWR